MTLCARQCSGSWTCIHNSPGRQVSATADLPDAKSEHRVAKEPACARSASPRRPSWHGGFEYAQEEAFPERRQPHLPLSCHVGGEQRRWKRTVVGGRGAQCAGRTPEPFPSRGHSGLLCGYAVSLTGLSCHPPASVLLTCPRQRKREPSGARGRNSPWMRAQIAPYAYVRTYR